MIILEILIVRKPGWFHIRKSLQFKCLITQNKFEPRLVSLLPVLAALVALLKFGSHHVPRLLLLHGILNIFTLYARSCFLPQGVESEFVDCRVKFLAQLMATHGREASWQEHPTPFNFGFSPAQRDWHRDFRDKWMPSNICTDSRVGKAIFKCLKYYEQHLQQLLVQVGLVKADVNGVPGGHHMVIVDNLIKQNLLYGAIDWLIFT